MAEAASQEDNGSPGSGTLPFGTKKEPHNINIYIYTERAKYA